MIGSGAIGALIAGFLADRWGRTTLTSIAMAISGLCAATVGLFFGSDPIWLVLICVVWGITIVADSAHLGVHCRVIEPASRRHDADPSNRAWLPVDAHHDPPNAGVCGHLRLALGLCTVGDRTTGRDYRDAPS